MAFASARALLGLVKPLSHIFKSSNTSALSLNSISFFSSFSMTQKEGADGTCYCLFLYPKAPQNCSVPVLKAGQLGPSQCCLASHFLQSSEKLKCLLSGQTLSSKYILVIAVKGWCQLYLKIKLYSTGLATPTAKLLLFRSHLARRLLHSCLHSCFCPSHRAPLHLTFDELS